jgi:hypothetical protein
MVLRSLAAALVVLVGCSSTTTPEAPAPDGGQPSDGTAPPIDAEPPADGGVTVGESTCSGHATITTIEPPGVPPQPFAIPSFLSTVITNADGTLTAYSGTDAADNCVFHYTKPVAGVATLVTPLTCPGPLPWKTATYTSGTSTLAGKSSSVALDADLTGMADGAVTTAKIVEVLTCVAK